MNTTFIVIVVIVAGIIFGVAAIYFFLLSERLKNQLKQVESDNSKSLQPTDDVKLIVDYTKTVEQAIADGNYDWKNSDVTAKNFPISPEMIGKKVDISGRLFHFDRNIGSENAIKKMDSDGCRPATLMELLALGATHPELQKQFPIIALGSVWRTFIGFRQVPYLDVNDNDRKLNLSYFGDDWWACCRFLGVR